MLEIRGLLESKADVLTSEVAAIFIAVGFTLFQSSKCVSVRRSRMAVMTKRRRSKGRRAIADQLKCPMVDDI